MGVVANAFGTSLVVKRMTLRSVSDCITRCRWPRVGRRFKFVCIAAFVLFAVPIIWLGPPPLGKNLDVSTQVVDREGQLLRAYANQIGRWRLPATVNTVDSRYLDALVAYEDKRFWQHRGVDPLALLRAIGQLVRNGRVVSGASTLTMQVARLLEPRRGRHLLAKIREI